MEISPTPVSLAVQHIALIPLSGNPELQADWPWLLAWLKKHYPTVHVLPTDRGLPKDSVQWVFFACACGPQEKEHWKTWKNRIQLAHGKLPKDLILWSLANADAFWLKEGFHWLVHGHGIVSLALLLKAIQSPLNPFFDGLPGIAFLNPLGKLFVQNNDLPPVGFVAETHFVAPEPSQRILPIQFGNYVLPPNCWPKHPKGKAETFWYADDLPEKAFLDEAPPGFLVLSPEASLRVQFQTSQVSFVLTALPKTWSPEFPWYLFPWQDAFPLWPEGLPLPMEVLKAHRVYGWRPNAIEGSNLTLRRRHNRWQTALNRLKGQPKRPFWRIF